MKYLTFIIVIALGMLGLHFRIEHSGWVLFAGLIGIIGS